MRSVVDLPQPEGPTSTMNSLSAISRLKSCTATTPLSVRSRFGLFSSAGWSSFFFFLAFFSSLPE